MKRIFMLSVCLLLGLSTQAQLAQNGVELFPNTPFDGNTASAHFDNEGVTDATIKDKLVADPTKWYQTSGNSDYAGAVIDEDGYQIGNLIYKKSANWYTNFVATRSTAKLIGGVYRLTLKSRLRQTATQVPFYLKIGRWDGASQVGAAEINIKRLGASENITLKKGTANGAIQFNPQIGDTWTTCTTEIYIEEPMDETALFGRLYFSFQDYATATNEDPQDASIRIDIKDVTFKRIGDLPLPAEKVYIRNIGDATSWSNIPVTEGTLIADVTSLNEVPDGKEWYLAPGAYNFVGITMLKNQKLYGGFSGQESSIDLKARAKSDLDGNGLIEPWEFTNRVYLQNANEPSASASTLRLAIQDLSVVDGVTIRNINSSYASTISVGAVIVNPDQPTSTKPDKGTEAVLRNSIITNIVTTGKGFLAINDYSTVEGCLIRECKHNSSGITMSGYQSILRNSKISNNLTAGGNYVYAVMPRVAQSGATPLIENCIFHNNATGTGGVGIIRAQASAKDQHAVNIVNCTFMNNAGKYAVEFMGCSGSVINSIITAPTASIRNNSAQEAQVLVYNCAMNKNIDGIVTLTDTRMDFTYASLKFTDLIPSTNGALDPATGDAAKLEEIYKATYKTSGFPSFMNGEVQTELYGISTVTFNDLRSNPITINAPVTDMMDNAQVDGKQPVGAFQPEKETSGEESISNRHEVTIYPTVVDKVIYLTGDDIEMVEVIGTSGQLLVSETITTSQLDLSALAKGVYFVRITTKQGTNVERIVKL